MGRAPCCDKANVKRGPWSPEEDKQLKEYIEKHGTGGNWISLPHKAGLRRCGKSCRLRWLNYLRPNIKLGDFSDDEDRIICSLFATIGSRWSIIAAHLPGRTDNDIKNYWNTKLKKRLFGLPPSSHRKSHPHHHQLITNQQHHHQPPLLQSSGPSPPVPDLEGIPISPHLLSSLTAAAAASSLLPPGNAAAAAAICLFGGGDEHRGGASESHGRLCNGGLEMEKLLLSWNSYGNNN